MERDHGCVVEICGELADATSHMFELGGCLDRDEVRTLRCDRCTRGSAGRTGWAVRRLTRFSSAAAMMTTRRGDAEGEGDGRECRPGAGLVAGEVSERQAHGDRDVPGRPREEANRQGAQEQRAEDRRQDPGDDERPAASV